MSRYSSLFFATCAWTCVLVMAPDSFAQARRLPNDDSDRVVYRFDDDPLTAGVVPEAPSIRVRPRAALETLVEPRASFVGPLIRSVETMGDPYPAPVRVRIPR